MANAIGVETKLAARLAATWGTAVACGATDGVLVRPHTIKKSRESNLDDSLGNFFAYEAHPGAIAVAGSVPAYMRYDGLDLLLAAVMGTSGNPAATVVGLASQTASAGSATTLTGAAGMGTTQYVGKWVIVTAGTNAGKARKIISHTDTVLTFATMTTLCDNTSVFTITGLANTHSYQLATSLDGIFITLCVHNGIGIDEYGSVKVTGMTLKGAIGGALEVMFDLLSYDRVTGSVINTTATFANVTMRESANRIYYDQGVIRANVASAGALGSTATYGTTDIIYPSSWELSFKRPMAGVYGLGGSYNLIDQPTGNGLPAAKLKLEFPRYTAAAWFSAWDAGTINKLDLVYTGALLSGSTYRKMTIEIPAAQLSNADLPMSEGILKHPLEFDLLGCSSSPTGMTAGTTLPFRITLVNGLGADVLQQGN